MVSGFKSLWFIEEDRFINITKNIVMKVLRSYVQDTEVAQRGSDH